MTEMPALNFVEHAGSVGASGITHYALRPPQPSPQAMNRAEKWRGKQNEQSENRNKVEI